MAKCSVTPARRRCAAPAADTAVPDQQTPIQCDIGIEQLRQRIRTLGNPDNERVYGYVVRTVHLSDGKFNQQGSGPNWQGGLITLCTCKHSMRSSLPAGEWLKGKWVAGLTGWNSEFDKQQSLVYLMRVGEAFGSQAELVVHLRASGRDGVVRAKDSSVHRLGDLMIPTTTGLSLDPNDPKMYHPPLLGHVHRQSTTDKDWETDIHYVGYAGREPVMLAGDSRYSFRWTRPVIRRSRPGYTRPYRIWTLSDLLADIEEVPV